MKATILAHQSMTMTTRLPLFFLATIFTFAACQKEADFLNPINPRTDSTVTPSAVSCRPVQCTIYNMNNVPQIDDSARYEYTGNLLTKVYFDTDKYYSYEYTGGKLTKRTYAAMGATAPYTADVFSYNIDGTLVSYALKIVSPTTETVDSTAFIYSGGKIISTKFYSNSNSSIFQLTEECFFTYTGSNISKQLIKQYYNGALQYTDTVMFTYDANPNYFKKQNPQYLQADPFFLLYSNPFDLPLVLSGNNVLTVTTSSSNPASGTFTNNWSYTTDTKGNLTTLKFNTDLYCTYRYQCQ